MKALVAKSISTLTAVLVLVVLLTGCDRAAMKDDAVDSGNSKQDGREPDANQKPSSDAQPVAGTKIAGGESVTIPDWRDAAKKVEETSFSAEELRNSQERNLDEYQKLKELGDEVISSSDRRLAWLELVSFLSKLTEADTDNSKDNEPGKDDTLNVASMHSEVTNNASRWFDNLPESTRQQLLAGKNEKPTGTVWIIRMEFEDSKDADVTKVPASVHRFVSRLQAKITSADLPREIGTLSHPFASREKGEDGKTHAGVSLLWSPKK